MVSLCLPYGYVWHGLAYAMAYAPKLEGLYSPSLNLDV
jgi:hypothetical protein